MTFSATDTPSTFSRRRAAELAAWQPRSWRWLELAMALLVVLAGLLSGCGGGSGFEPPVAMAPQLTISSNVAGTASGPVTLRFKFSADVAAFPSGSLPFAMSGARQIAGSFAKVSPSEFTTVVQPDVSKVGSISITVPAGAFSDSSGQAPSTQSYTFSQPYNTVVPDTEPLVDISAGASTASGQFTITLTFNIDVGSSFTLDKLSLSVLGSSDPLARATASALTKVSPTVYTALITPVSTTSGLVVVTLPKGAVTGLVSGVSNSRDWQYGFFYTKAP